MRASLARVLISVAALVAIEHAPAHADKAAAEQLFRVGQRAYEAGRFLEAAGAMEAAYREWDSPDIAFSTAQAYRLHYFESRATGSLVRSAELYRVYLEAVPSGGRRADAALNLAELEPILRALTPAESVKPPELTRIGVSASVEGAEVSFEGGPFTEAPAFATVSPGRHRFRARAPGYFSKNGELQVFEGQFAVAEVELEPIPARVRVEVEPGTEVYVGGKRASRPQALLLPPGSHRIDVVKRGYRLVTIDREFERDTSTIVRPKLQWTSRRKISLGLLGASAIAYGAALGTGIAALNSHLDASELEDLRRARGLTVQERDRFNDLLDDRDRRKVISYAFAGIGTGLAVSGALVFFFDVPELGQNVTPTVSPGGLGLQGRF